MKTLFKRAGRTQDVATICQVAAVLLDYPRDGDEWVLTAALPPQLRAFADDWFALDLTDRQERYVAAFDLRRDSPARDVPDPWRHPQPRRPCCSSSTC